MSSPETRPMSVQQAFELALAHHRAGRLKQAAEVYEALLQVEPRHAPALHLLGEIALNAGQIEVALELISRSVAIDPTVAETHHQIGTICLRLRRYEQAVLAFQKAIALQPNAPEWHHHLGFALARQGRPAEAVKAYQQTLRLLPDTIETLHNLANALKTLGRLDEAETALRRAIALQPANGVLYGNLAGILKNQGRPEEAVDTYRQALALNPDLANEHSLLIYTLYFDPRATPQMIAEEQARWDERFAKPLAVGWIEHPNEREADRKLRIGYVSPDLCGHVIGFNLHPLFTHHDRARFEIYGYASVAEPDTLTHELRSHCGTWRDCLHLNDEQLAALIRQDCIDILVDLSQHLQGNRLGVFARNPAPVQVSFAGYPAGTGLEAIGHRLSDSHLEATALPSPERVHPLDSFWCYSGSTTAQPVSNPPFARNGFVTFGNLNNFSKINDPLLRLWASVLRAVPTSRLLLLAGPGSHRERTLQILAGEGVDPARVEFVDRCPRDEYLALYHRIDIGLDSFPYNGHTTSLDANWMGVPVVTLVGETTVSRAALSQSANLGLVDLVAHTPADFIRIATGLANDEQRLAQLRATLRGRMADSVLMNGAHFTKQIETAYRAMWTNWCARAVERGCG